MGGIHTGRVAGDGSTRGSGIMEILGAGDMSIADRDPAELPPLLITVETLALGEMSVRVTLRDVSKAEGGCEACEWVVHVTLPS